MPSSSTAPHRLQYTFRSSKHSPMPSGNHMIAARTPVLRIKRVARDAHIRRSVPLFPRRSMQKETAWGLTEDAKLAAGVVPALLQADHLRVVRGQEGDYPLARERVHVVVHDRRGRLPCL